jgi:rRNA maturation RNase YbeY
MTPRVAHVQGYGVRGIISASALAQAAERTLSAYGGSADHSCVIHVVSEKYMRTLNKQTRGIDKSTDVLSFPLYTQGDVMSDGCIGDIFISPSVVRQQAKLFGVSAQEEYIRMAVHGVLHCLRYDHDTPAKARRMFAAQERIVHLCV